MARRTKAEALATRDRLLDAAEQLFQAQGVSQTSLQQIAQQAGATRGAIYWHFKDKAALFNAMMERATMPFEVISCDAERHNEDDPLGAIERGMVEALTLMTTDPRVRRVFEVATHKVEYTQEMESVYKRHLEARDACVADFEKALRLAARRAGVKLPVPATAAAHGMHALMSGLIENWLLEPGRFPLVSTGRRAFRVYMAGLGFDQFGAATALTTEAEPETVVL